ncbi:hypothetical protein E3J85_01070 [Patescibacteria group bacterium]|nr:MAG: hypothetical protein E3J85_01070 [Patescibacteria group bacterium]
MISESKRKLKRRKLKWIKVPFWLAGILLVVGAGAYLSYRYLINPEAFAEVPRPPEINNLTDIERSAGKWEVEVRYFTKGCIPEPGKGDFADLERSETQDSGYVFIAKASMYGLVPPEGALVVDDGEVLKLEKGKTYYYRLVWKGTPSGSQSITIGEAKTIGEGGEEKPPAPQDLTAEPGNQTVTLQWKGGSKTKGEAVGGSKGTVEGLQVVAAAETEGSGQAAKETAGDGRLYNIYRGAKMSISESSESSESQRSDGGGNIAVPYKGDGIGYVLIPESPVGGYKYSDTGLTNGVTYYYFVKEVANNKEGDSSNKVSAIPREEGAIEPPANLSAKSNWYSVSLSWDQVKGADGYRIYYGKTAGEYEEPIEIRKVTTEKDQQETYDVGIDKINYGIYYYFTVAALKGTQESAKPDPVYERALIPGDLDYDKDVDPDDFQTWVSWWLEFQKGDLTISRAVLEGDFNKDGKVDPEDFAIWDTWWLAYEEESGTSKAKLSE